MRIATWKEEVTQQDPLIDLLWEMQPQLQRIFRRFRISTDLAETMLEDCMMVLVYRYDQLVRPDRWLLRTLRHRCVRHWRDRRKRLCTAVDTEIRQWIEDESISNEEKDKRRLELNQQIDRLPRRCRPLLRQTYGLPVAAGEVFADTRDPRVSLRPGPHKPEDPFVRCITRLMRQLIEDRSFLSVVPQ